MPKLFSTSCASSYALIHLTENIQEALDEGKYGCGIFDDLKKPFDTVDHKVLLGKLNLYDIRGVAQSWFELHLKDNNVFQSIKVATSSLFESNRLFTFLVNILNSASWHRA